ncbi:MAG: site-specific integrase [Candidatus Bathyarchaeia archaeon]
MKRQPLTLQQLDTIISLCDKLRDKALIAWLYATAARVSEIVKVFKKSDVKILADHIEATVKTEKNREQPFRVLYLPLNDKYVKLSLSYIMSAPDQQPVWNMSRQYVHKLLRMLGYKIGVKLHPHLIRHTRLTHLVIYADFNEFQLMRWAGWSSIEPALKYVHLSNKDSLPKLKAAAVQP